jgi:drug/metabolite transporter (DMT)-like permease
MMPRAASPLRGIGYMCIAVLVLPFLNAAAKLLLADGHSVVQVVWARYAVHLAFVAVVFAPRHGVRLLRTRRPGIQVTRSALLLGCTACYFTALGFISLPMAAAINFTAPIIVTVLAIPMLGEQVGWRRLSAATFGFAGALVIIRPGAGAVHPAGLLVLATAVMYAFYQILTRRVSASDPAHTSVAWMAVVGTLLASVVLPWFWTTPQGLRGWLLLLSTGGFAALGHFFVVKALQHAPASVVSPFSYGQLLGAAVLGYALFGQLPDRWTWVGAAMIVGSGLYITYREEVRRRAAGRAGSSPG